MKQQNNLIALVILSIISCVLTFFAPLAKETTEGLFSTYSRTISLFGGVNSSFCVALTVIAGMCLILFTCIRLFGSTEGKGIVGARISGIALLVLQIICIIQSMNYYDDSSLLGALRSEVSQMSIHPIAFITMIVTLIAIIMCFKTHSGEIEQENRNNVDEQ